ncbi:MAG: ATP-binding protein [Bacteroidales bacterium]
MIPVIKRALYEHEQKLKIKLLEVGEALIKSEIKYKNFVNEVSDGYFVTNNQDIITFANISLAKIFGFISPEEMTGHLFTKFNKKSDTQDVSYNFKNIIKNKKNVNGLELEVFRVDSNPIHIEIKAVPVLEDGKIVGMQGVIRDITERKRAELKLILANKELAFQNDEKEKRAAELIIANKELVYQNDEKEKRTTELILANEAILQSEENFRRSISESPMGIRIVSTDGKTIYANKAFLAIFELNSLEEFTSTPVINRYTSESYAQHQERKENRKNGHDVFDYEISIVCKNAEIRHIKVSRKEVLWNGIKHYQVINFDITEQKKLTIDLIAAKERAEESDRLKSAFLANMSHEIRTPMNGILGFAKLLKTPNLSSYDQQNFIQTIQISGARMLNTINNIVNISKIESGLMKVDIKESNINEQIKFLYAFFKPEVESKGMQFFFKNGLPSKEAFIKTDIEKIYAILTNLIKNAIKFTYEGSIEFGYEKKDEYLEFFVKDMGIGIPENQTELIFERFRQGSESLNRGYEGSGLGLSISKSYVEMLGGEIWVESEEGKGSIFYFTIPYNAVSEEKSAIRKDVFEEDKEVQVKKLKILIAEDDKISNFLLTSALQKISKEVLHAITGVQAVEACRNNPDLDLVLMDIKMSDMNGYEATRQIRQFNTDVIIIAQTAYGFSDDREKAIEAGCNDYISKPINHAVLLSLIQRHFNKL